MTVLKKIFKHFLVSTNKYFIYQRHWHQYVTHFLSRPVIDWGKISRKKFNNFEKKSVIFLHQWDLFCYICLQLNEKRFWSCSLILKKRNLMRLFILFAISDNFLNGLCAWTWMPKTWREKRERKEHDYILSSSQFELSYWQFFFYYII